MRALTRQRLSQLLLANATILIERRSRDATKADKATMRSFLDSNSLLLCGIRRASTQWRRQMSQPTNVRKSKWRWIAHVTTFIAALLGTCSVTVSAHSTDLYQYRTYPTPQYQAPPHYYHTGGSPNCPSCGCGQCGCGPCGCGPCGCGQCAVAVQAPRAVIERRIVKHEYIERRYMDGCCQEQSYDYPRSHENPPVYPSEYGQRSPFPYGYGGVRRGQPPYGYSQSPR